MAHKDAISAYSLSSLVRSTGNLAFYLETVRDEENSPVTKAL